MIRTVGVVIVAVAFGIGLYFQGWATVPLVGAIYAVASRRRSAPQDAMLGAMIAAIALLVPQMIMPTFLRLLEKLGSIFPMPGITVLALTVLLMMILAFTSARVALGIVGTRDPRAVRVDPRSVRVGG
jgi:hypothetical protein